MEGNNNTNKIDIAVLGHILNEKIIFTDRQIYPVLGSPAAYSSACMASLGSKVGVVTKIGRGFPQSLLKVFDELMVNKDGVVIGKNSTNNELIYNACGNKTLRFVTKAEEIFFTDIPNSYFGAEIFYICPMDYEVNVKTIEKISNLGKIMAVDLGGYGGGTSDTHPEGKDGNEIKKLCPYFNIVKASIEDYYYIFGAHTCDEKEISRKLIGWGAEISAITLGEKGSFIKTKDNESYIPSFPIKRVVDQTGAGDCYSAGFLVSFLVNEDPYVSAMYATAATSYVVERSGGVVASRMPDMGEVEKRVKIIKNLMK